MPRPNLRRDVVDDLVPVFLKFFGQAQIKPGIVEKEHRLWSSLIRQFNEPLVYVANRADMFEYFDEADNGHFFGAADNLKAEALHFAAADTKSANVTAGFLPMFEKSAGVKRARGFGGDD